MTISILLSAFFPAEKIPDDIGVFKFSDELTPHSKNVNFLSSSISGRRSKMAQPDIKPVLFIGVVKLVPSGNKGVGTEQYCIARFKDEQTLVGMVPESKLKDAVKRAKEYLKNGIVRKVVFVPPSGNFVSPDGTVRYVFAALSRDELNVVKKMFTP